MLYSIPRNQIKARKREEGKINVRVGIIAKFLLRLKIVKMYNPHVAIKQYISRDAI